MTRSPAADIQPVSTRIYLSIGLAIAALAVGGWRMLLPSAGGEESTAVAGAVSSVVDRITAAQFTGAQATLDAQRQATGSYAGAPVVAPMHLVRADAASYCIEFVQDPVVQHLDGPGGQPVPGAC
jgi:hypothetical protein